MIDQGLDVRQEQQPAVSFRGRHAFQTTDEARRQGTERVRWGVASLEQFQHPADVVA